MSAPSKYVQLLAAPAGLTVLAEDERVPVLALGLTDSGHVYALVAQRGLLTGDAASLLSANTEYWSEGYELATE